MTDAEWAGHPAGTVAYRSRDERQLRCLDCVPRESWTHLDWLAIADDHIDGDARWCTECGRELIIG